MVKKKIICIVMVLIGLGIWAELFAAADVPRISKEELKSMLGNPDLVIIDVRKFLDLKMSAKQIKGAVREDPDLAKVKSWSKKYPKGKTIVLYCS